VPAKADYSSAAKAYGAGDYTTAFKEYLALAKAGDAQSEVNLGWMYYSGEGVTADKQKALEWYRRAAEKGNTTALFNLGYAYENGDGVRKDLDEAHRWYSKSDALGDKASHDAIERIKQQRSLLITNTRSDTKKTDARTQSQESHRPEKAVSQVTAGSESNTKMPSKQSASASASVPSPSPTLISAPVTKKEKFQTVVAIPLETKKTEATPSRVDKIRLAAESGDLNAMVALGWIFSNGKEVPTNKQEAVKWYRLAAGKGEPNAQMALGWLYFSGDAVKRDLKEAAYWYGKAAAQGNIKAKEMLKRVR
jgi:TPR repeat protein